MDTNQNKIEELSEAFSLKIAAKLKASEITISDAAVVIDAFLKKVNVKSSEELTNFVEKI